jgi:hypothetical protein
MNLIILLEERKLSFLGSSLRSSSDRLVYSKKCIPKNASLFNCTRPRSMVTTVVLIAILALASLNEKYP